MDAVYDNLRAHDFDRSCLDSLPEGSYGLLLEAVQTVAAARYARAAREPPAEVASLRLRRLELLERRAALRRRLVDEPACYELLCEVVDDLRRVSRQLVRAVRATAKERQRRLEEELHQSWRRQRHAEVQRLARQLAGTGFGAKKRRFAAPPATRFATTEWDAKLAAPGCEGACSWIS